MVELKFLLREDKALTDEELRIEGVNQLFAEYIGVARHGQQGNLQLLCGHHHKIKPLDPALINSFRQRLASLKSNKEHPKCLFVFVTLAHCFTLVHCFKDSLTCNSAI